MLRLGGCQTMGLTSCRRGRVGGGQGVRPESLIEAVNHAAYKI